MRLTTFTRPTVIAAVEVLERHSQASFDQLVLPLELETEIPTGTELSVAKKCGLLGRAAPRGQRLRPALPSTVWTAWVGRWMTLLPGPARDGYVVTWDTTTAATRLLDLLR